MIKKIFLTVLLVSFVFGFFDSCRVSQLEKKLDPESSEFISLVRYIITPGEYDRFMNLPAQEREKFIENFWKRRDPDPETEENEFKEAFLVRLAEAREIFSRGVGGYLTDRGMIYVLFGPPDYVYHFQASIYDRSQGVREQWYYFLLLDKYHDVKINFIDRMGSSGFSGPQGFSTGTFELDRGGSSVFSLIQEEKESFLAPGKKDSLFKYHIRIKKLEKEGNSVKLLIQIQVPYKNIWFAKAEDKMKATFSVKAKILDDSKNKIWEHEQDYSLTVSEKEVEELLKVRKEYVIEIPAALETGKYSLHISITDNNEGKEEKVLPLKI
jgi:GWxTD domain-containing protein